ncbi:MAG: GNAT family N-acetyltransferase [Acidobacteriia bacterium]|nr:GNAT family N-acetyltransferase [Methyloceanibacter sp.]MBX5470891.1 GNAT family N-acetyltransferase [Acetobacteraceae bacterium]MCL6491278.1 GNAT family N-acetyltransferase [Terriglobia bacterium]
MARRGRTQPPPEPDADPAIRPATLADVAGVIALDEEVTGLRKAAYWQDMFERYGARRRDQRFFLVAGEPARIDGFIIGEVRAWEFGSPPAGWIFAVQVRPRLRVRGLGSRLFAAVCARFRAAGVDRVRTMVARDNAVIHAFFRSQGMMAGPFIELEMRLD